MAQFLVPSSDQATGSWTNPPLWSKADTDDGTDAISEAVGNNTQTSVADLALGSGGDPSSSTGHIMRVQWHHDQNGRSMQATAELYEGDPAAGGTLIATLTSASNVGTTEVEDTYTLSASEADSITDYSNLYVRLYGFSNGGGPSRSLHVDLFEFEVPDATVSDAQAQVSWAEFEVPAAPRAGQVSWAELEVPDSSGMAVSSVTTTSISGVDPSFDMPATRPDGDLYVLVVGNDDFNDPDGMSAPTGWTQLHLTQNPAADTLGALVAWRIGSSEPASYTLPTNLSTFEGGAVVIRVSGADTTTPIDVSDSDTADSGSSVVAPDVTTTVDGTLLLRLFQSDGESFSTIPATEEYDFEPSPASAPMAGSSEPGPDPAGSTGTSSATLATGDNWIAFTVAVNPLLVDARLEVSWAELEVPTAPRQSQVSWVELEVPTAPREGQVSWAELEVPTAPRVGQVSWAELETPLAPRVGQVSWAELEVPNGPRQAQVSWSELEIPTAPRQAQVSWAEMEVNDAPRQGQVSWSELEVPDVPTDDKQGQVSWAELEVPDAPREGQVSWAELEVPTSPRIGQVSWAELEVPTAPRRAAVSWSELEVPTAPRAGQISWAELEVPPANANAQISWAELEVPEVGGPSVNKFLLLGVRLP